MSAKFFALLTVIGANKLAKATALGTTLKLPKWLWVTVAERCRHPIHNKLNS